MTSVHVSLEVYSFFEFGLDTRVEVLFKFLFIRQRGSFTLMHFCFSPQVARLSMLCIRGCVQVCNRPFSSLSYGDIASVDFGDN